MKKIKPILTGAIIFLLCAVNAFADESKLVKPEKPYDHSAPYAMHNWGFAWSRVTRLQLQKERSNFVWQDDMVGLFYSCQTGNLPVNFLGKVSVYYPYHYEFNKVEQKLKQIILYSLDLNLGPIWTIPVWQLFYLDLAPMVNFRYQIKDSFHHCDLGLGAFIGFELPVTKTISALLNTEFTYDCGNLGSNSKAQPYNHVWSYNFEIGCRITKRGKNSFSYVKTKEEIAELKEEAARRKEESAQKKEERAKLRAEKKEEAAREKEKYQDDLNNYKKEKKRRAEAKRAASHAE